MNEKFREKGGPSYQGIQVRKLVHSTKMKQVGGDTIAKVEVEYSRTKKDAFLRHSSFFPTKKAPSG